MNNKDKLPFGRKNYILMITGIAVLILGFTLMGLDTEPYGFGVLGITIGPITIIVGFVIEFFAILSKPE